MSKIKSELENRDNIDLKKNNTIKSEDISAYPASPEALPGDFDIRDEMYSDEELNRIDEEYTCMEDAFDSELPDMLKTGRDFYKFFRIFCILGFVIFTALFINEEVIQPYRIKKSIDLTRELYKPIVAAITATSAPDSDSIPISASVAESYEEQSISDSLSIAPSAEIITVTPSPAPDRDEQGRLLQFKDLLALNEEVKGWIIIPDTNINYVVMQSGEEHPDFYLHNDINKKYCKAGTLYLDYRTSIESNSKNYVIYGHNMVSTTEKMFHSLLNYKDKDLEFYKLHPLITFDTIYQTGAWKIFAVFITTPYSDKEGFFDYRKSEFKDASDFLNFVYQIRIRSLLNIDYVDMNENDQLLLLSTCSYEVNHNYRTVVAARKVREGEDNYVDVDSVTQCNNPLYAEDYYEVYGGEVPELYATFEEALAEGDIKWYNKPDRKPQNTPVQ